MRNEREAQEPKVGAGHAGAMFRLGLAELRTLGAFNDSNVVQPTQYGLYGTRTPGEVAEARRFDARDPEEELGHVLAVRVRQAEARHPRQRFKGIKRSDAMMSFILWLAFQVDDGDVRSVVRGSTRPMPSNV